METFEIVIVVFWVDDKGGKICFFEKIFLLANISINMALEMLFLTLSNKDNQFIYRELQ